MTELSDEGLKCLNTLEIWFLSSMVLTMVVSLIALVRAWNHRHDFKKVILSRYKWFGIDHGGSSTTKNAHIPTQSPEFAEPCRCFEKLGRDFISFKVIHFETNYMNTGGTPFCDTLATSMLVTDVGDEMC